MSRLPYQPALDGIRAAAVSIVLFFHAGFEWASGAFLGISTFFTLSGFLIAGILVAEYEETSDIGLRAFWMRRIRRLMPAALLTLFGMSFYAAFVADPSELLQIRGDVLSALFYVANWRFWLTGQSYLRILSDPSPVQHLWSLGIEEQFYLFFPVLVLVTCRWSGGSRRALAAVLVGCTLAATLLTIALYGTGEGYSRVYYGTDTRAPELLVGALLALWCTGRTPSTRRSVAIAVNGAGLACLVAIVWLWVVTSEGAAWFFEGGALPYALATAGVILAAIRSGPVRTILSVPPLRWIGWISYGLYVYHWPIFLWLDAESTHLDGWALFAVRLAVTYLVATLSYVLLEAPIRTRRLRWGRGGKWVVPIGIVLVAVSITAVTDRLYRPGLGAEDVVVEEEIDRPLASGAGLRVLVVGDSVARNLGRGLNLWGREHGGLRVSNRARVACGVARGERRPLAGGVGAPAGPRCSGWTQAWPAEIARFRPDVIVVVSGIWDLVERRIGDSEEYVGPGDPRFDAWLLAEYEEAVEVLGVSDAPIVWLTFPCAETKHYPALLDVDAAMSDENVRHLNEVILARLAARWPGRVHLVPLYDEVCPGGVFRHEVGPISNARPDGLHFKMPEATWLAGWLAPQLARHAAKRSVREERVTPRPAPSSARGARGGSDGPR